MQRKRTICEYIWRRFNYANMFTFLDYMDYNRRGYMF